MNDKDLDLKALENADEATIKRIAADCPASDEEKERMFAMSRKIYNSRTNEGKYNSDEEVSGVDIYRKPKWHKFASVAAALMIVTGVAAGGVMLSRNKADHRIVSSETEASTSPFGDLSDYRVRILSAAAAPSVFEPSSDKKLALTEALNNAEWNEISTDTPIPDGERQIIYFKKGDITFSLMFYMDGTIYYNTGSDGKRYQIDEKTQNVISQTLKYDSEAGDKLITVDLTSVDSIDTIWQDTAEPEVTTEPDLNTEENETMSEVYFPPLNTTLKIPAKNCSFYLGEWNEKTVFSCENVPELTEVFGNIKWDKQTEMLDDENVDLYISFRCSDDHHVYIYDIFTNDYIVLKCQNTDNGNVTTDIYSVSSEDSNTLFNVFFQIYDTLSANMLPNELFTHERPTYAFISRTGESNVITHMDAADEEDLDNTLISASWERLPDENETGDCVYKLRITVGRGQMLFSICDDNTAYCDPYGKFKISSSLIEELARISDNVWAKVSPENYTDKMPANKEEVLQKGIQIYDEAVRKYQNFGPTGLDLDIAEGTSQQFEDGNSGWLIHNVNSIDEINDMYHEFFSDRYPENDIRNSGMLFEEEGQVYLRPVGKGSDIFFKSTELSDVLYQKDDEIFFLVNNHYDDTEFDGNDKWTERTLFSVVIQPDGSWKVGKFTIPY